MTATGGVRSGLLVGAVVVVLVCAGCGGDDEPSASPTSPTSPTSAVPSPASPTSAVPSSADTAVVDPAPSASATVPAAPASYLPVPAGVALSAQGGALAVGAAATVAWQPSQDVVGVLDLTVDRLEQTTLEESFTGWKIPDDTATATPYFVRATVTNRGDTDLSGVAVPLYAVDGAQSLIQATSFASTFKPCRDGVFPAAFVPGASAAVCLVYFVPAGDALTAVSFRPTQEFNPITWTGELLEPGSAPASAQPSQPASTG